VDLKQQLPFPDKRTLAVILRLQIARDLRLDGGVHEAIERPDPFAFNRDIALLHFRDLNHRWRRSIGRVRGLGATYAAQCSRRKDEYAECAGENCHALMNLLLHCFPPINRRSGFLPWPLRFSSRCLVSTPAATNLAPAPLMSDSNRSPPSSMNVTSLKSRIA